MRAARNFGPREDGTGCTRSRPAKARRRIRAGSTANAPSPQGSNVRRPGRNRDGVVGTPRRRSRLDGAGPSPGRGFACPAGQIGHGEAQRPTPGQSSVDTRHVTRYVPDMIKTFANKRTRDLYLNGRARWFPPEVAARAVRRLEYVHLATKIEDLLAPPGNRLHALEGGRKGQYSISINDQWRVCFRFEDGDANDVEVCDYH